MSGALDVSPNPPDVQLDWSIVAISIEMTWDESVTLGELEQFIAHARAGGASAGTVIKSVNADSDPMLQLGWRVHADGEPEGTDTVPMPHRLMWQVQSLLDQFASGDGDIRGDLSEVGEYATEIREALMKHATR